MYVYICEHGIATSEYPWHSWSIISLCVFREWIVVIRPSGTILGTPDSRAHLPYHRISNMTLLFTICVIPDPYSCLILSANFSCPNFSKFITPCSLKSTPFIFVTSCAGALLTLLATTTGSTSRMTPSSTISSIARDTRS